MANHIKIGSAKAKWPDPPNLLCGSTQLIEGGGRSQYDKNPKRAGKVGTRKQGHYDLQTSGERDLTSDHDSIPEKKARGAGEEQETLQSPKARKEGRRSKIKYETEPQPVFPLDYLNFYNDHTARQSADQ